MVYLLKVDVLTIYQYNMLHKLAYVLVIIGAVNWGLIGFFQLNLVTKILGDMTNVSRIVYALVGLSAVYLVATRR